MKHNIGIGDRVVRFLGGILFIFAGVFVLRNNLVQGILLVLGIIAVLESFFGYCYLYRLFVFDFHHHPKDKERYHSSCSCFQISHLKVCSFAVVVVFEN